MRAQAARDAIKSARRGISLQHLLDAAERVFAARGYEGTRIRDVAAEAGLALATVYDLVSSKEALYAEIHRTRGRALLARAMENASAPGSALDALLRGIAAYVEFLTEHPHYLRIELRESRPWALKPRFPSQEQRRHFHKGLGLAVQVFRLAIDEGSVIDEDPELLARLMIAAHQVYLGAWVEGGMKEAPSMLIARMQQHTLRAFARSAI